MYEVSLSHTLHTGFVFTATSGYLIATTNLLNDSFIAMSQLDMVSLL